MYTEFGHLTVPTAVKFFLTLSMPDIHIWIYIRVSVSGKSFVYLPTHCTQLGYFHSYLNKDTNYYVVKITTNKTDYKGLFRASKGILEHLKTCPAYQD